MGLFKKYFTLSEANALLPAIRQELAKLRTMKAEFETKLSALKRGRLEGITEDEAFRLECELEFLQMEGRLYMNTIAKLGAELKDIESGLIDFPAVKDGKAVYLCWKDGEEQISYYHGLEDGYVGRKRVHPEDWE